MTKSLSLLPVATILLLSIACSRETPAPAPTGSASPTPAASASTSETSPVASLPPEVRQALGEFRPVPPAILEALSNDPAPEVRAQVAYNPSATLSILERLARDPEAGVKLYVASNPRTPRRILLELWTDADDARRVALAVNPNWTADELRRMQAKGEVSKVALARNPSLPADLQVAIAGEANLMEALELSRNRGLVPDAAKLLAKSREKVVRTNLSENGALSDEFLRGVGIEPRSRRVVPPPPRPADEDSPAAGVTPASTPAPPSARTAG